MKVAVVGAGTVGRAVGVGLLQKGNQVIFLDTNPQVCQQLSKDGLKTARSTREAIKDAEVVFLCLPTPSLERAFDLSFIETAAEEISGHLEDQTVALKSTVLPGTTERLSSYIPATRLAYNPEFLRAVTPLQDFLNPHRIVIGARSSDSIKILKRLYQSFNAPIVVTDWETAEIAKLVSNSFLATKISFFNEVWSLCRFLGVDAEVVGKIVGADQRIGPYGTRGGFPFDGPCLPKDTQAFRALAEQTGKNLQVLAAALRVNNDAIGVERSRSELADFGKDPKRVVT